MRKVGISRLAAQMMMKSMDLIKLEPMFPAERLLITDTRNNIITLNKEKSWLTEVKPH